MGVVITILFSVIDPGVFPTCLVLTEIRITHSKLYDITLEFTILHFILVKSFIKTLITFFINVYLANVVLFPNSKL